MICSCSMTFSCPKHCFLMLFLPFSVFSLNLWSWYLLHFCHACVEPVNVWSSRSSVFIFSQASPVDYSICFFAMLECCSIVACCIWSAIMLLIADSRHSCFARHLQTVHPIPVIFISISTEIISSFQWHTWFAKLLPCSFFFFRSTHMHRKPHLAYHACFASCCLCISRDWLWFHCLCSCCG